MSTVSAEKSSAAVAAAKHLSPLDLNAAMAAIKLGDPDTYASVVVPTATVVGAPVIMPTSDTSSSDDESDIMVVVWVLVAVAAVIVLTTAYVMTIKHSKQRAEAVVLYKEKANGIEVGDVEVRGNVPINDQTIRI